MREKAGTPNNGENLQQQIYDRGTYIEHEGERHGDLHVLADDDRGRGSILALGRDGSRVAYVTHQK